MTPDLIVFIALAIISILAAIGLLTSRNAIYAALFLILNFATVAVLYLMLNAPFLAVIQVSVYAGAIMVLFLFVIMLLGAERLAGAETQSEMRWQRPLAVGLGALLLIQAGYVFITHFSQSPASPKAIQAGPMEIGMMLFGPYLLPFEVTSVLLLVAIIGAVVLTRDK
ncbi:MAG: NADH-quinone oxidoreductase subunit J [Chloroflexi bacterium]|nr:NADH-quinone oxidoreductase subunit J [Chloroflexota bacterium]MCL5274324.1 NADH-quinone oxidoreductase subunit J [Chloroflexota bacterium]